MLIRICKDDPLDHIFLASVAEGISYLVVVAIIGWSIATKVKTGSGLPAGPGGLLGAVEGVSYLSLLGGKADRDCYRDCCLGHGAVKHLPD